MPGRAAHLAGGVAGLRYSGVGILADWREGLRGQDLLAPLLARLLQHVNGQRGAGRV
jgi:hypothetical protein